MDDEFRVMELLKMILKPVVPMECQPVRNPTAFHRMWIIRAKDLFSVLPLVVLLILVGCGGGSGTNSGDPPAGDVSTSVVSISVTPADPSIPVGVTKQFAASGAYSDGTSHNITAQVTWSSSNPSVATVNGSGLATAASAGTATITATSGSISANTILTVSSGGSGGTINLAWNPSTGPGVAGYKVYYGTASRAYSNSIDVGNATTYDLTGLTKGQTYFIATTAYDTSHNESGYSNEVSGVAQ